MYGCGLPLSSFNLDEMPLPEPFLDQRFDAVLFIFCFCRQMKRIGDCVARPSLGLNILSRLAGGAR